VVSAIQPEAADLFAHHLTKPRLHLLGQGDCPEAENRYAETVFKKDPEEFASGLFKLLEPIRRLHRKF